MKRLLILTSRMPVPLTSGEKIRILNICRGLSREYELVLLSICGSREEMAYMSEDLSIFKEVHRVYVPTAHSLFKTACALFTSTPLQVAYYKSSRFARMVAQLLPGVDGVICHLVRTSDYVRDVQGMPKVLEMTDTISLTYERFARYRQGISVKSLAYAREYKRLKRYERDVVEDFDMVSLISEVDKQYLTGMGTPGERIQVFTNGVNIADLPFVGPSQGSDIIFIGNMRTVPNLDACRFMASKVLPLLRQKMQDVRFKIIGETPPAAAQELGAYPGVHVVGRVDRIADAVDGAFAAVCPMRFGAGVQNKVLEYLALGIPCVTSSLGLEGIAATPGRDILVADTEEEIAAAIMDIREKPDLASGLSKAGRSFVEREHTWPPIQDAYCRELKTLLD